MASREPGALVDTSVLVRYLTGDHDELSERAAGIVDGRERLVVTPVVLAETAYVLEKVYGVPRMPLAEALTALVGRFNLSVRGLPKEMAFEALALCRDSRSVSWADALVWAEARADGAPRIYTFDRRFPADGVSLADRATRPGPGPEPAPSPG